MRMLRAKLLNLRNSKKYSLLKLIKKNLNRVVLLLLIVSLAACKNRRNELDVPGFEMDQGMIEIPQEAMGDIIDNISSPIEMAALIKDLGLPFSGAPLTDLSNTDQYQTNFQTAYMLGMLGADLGYLNVYNKTGSSVNYLSEINRFADRLKVSQFFDFSTLKRLATSSSNLDSLIFLSVHSFNRMDEHLRETGRSNLSALMIAGVWIEGMYQITQVSKSHYDPVLAEYIGEQKLILNDLIIILKNYERDDQFVELIRDYEALKDVFDRVEISYELAEPVAVEEDGMLVVVQQEESKVEISRELLDDIIAITATFRNKHQQMK